MEEPHGEYRPYAAAIDTFNWPRSGAYIAWPDQPNSSTPFVDDENISHDLQELFRDVPFGKDIDHENSLLRTVFISNMRESGIVSHYLDNETVDVLHASESNYWALRYFAALQFIQQRLGHSANPQWFTVNYGPPLAENVISAWFTNLIEEAQEPGEAMPTNEVIQESMRIVSSLRSELPEDVDVYPEDNGRVAIETYGKPGNAFLLVCEPGGGALCVVTVEGISRRARYENSSLLPDGFLREGIRDVQPEVIRDRWWRTLDW